MEGKICCAFIIGLAVACTVFQCSAINESSILLLFYFLLLSVNLLDFVLFCFVFVNWCNGKWGVTDFDLNFVWFLRKVGDNNEESITIGQNQKTHADI